MSKIELDNVLSGYNLSKINSNFQKIEDELNNKVMYRNPPVGEPNQLEQDVDANGKRIYNLASPTNRSEAVTLGFLEDRVGGTLEVTSWNVEAFAGDGVSSQFILTTEPASLESVFVSVDGLNYIPAVDFSILSGNILQFNEVPYDGANISVRYGTFLGGGSGLTTISNMPQSAGDNGLVANGTLGTIKNLKAGSNITLTSEGERITISSTASGGETTAANKGSGTGVFDSKVGNELRFKSLVASGNITLSASADTITIGSSSSVGEANTASNRGVGTGLFWNKVGTDLQFKSLSPAGTIQISSPDSSHVVIDCTARTTLANNFPVPGSVGVYGTRSGETLLFKPLVAGTGISIDDGLFDDRITISATGGGSSLPSQSGNAGKFLKTDGVLLSWGSVFDAVDGKFVPLAPNTTVKTINTDRINISNTGSYATTTDLISSGDAHRIHKKINWNASGNDATFHVETEANCTGPNYGPIHGGVWSSVTATGGPSPIFGMLASAHRKHTGAAYGMHAEVWDRIATPGLLVAYNAEAAQTPSFTVAGSTYIGYNFGIGETATNAIGLQIQSNVGAVSNNYLAAIKLDQTKSFTTLDYNNNSSSTYFLTTTSGNAMISSTAPGAVWGRIKIRVDGVDLYIPVHIG